MGNCQYQRVRDDKREHLIEKCRAPGVHKRWPPSIAPRIEEDLEPCRPCLGDRTNGDEGREMHGERSYAHAANCRVSPRQANDEWSSERPWQPGRQFGSEEG